MRQFNYINEVSNLSDEEMIAIERARLEMPDANISRIILLTTDRLLAVWSLPHFLDTYNERLKVILAAKLEKLDK